ncbi:hypothetical protein BAUCODRAFT_156309 [Baudoinia panamericana UAMH 10762]|uniref:Peptidase A1 domain-containing protein n=1 Tax=Baudoinia panamericana (strain UAMH 10762) TaxID=717646 RepID=M2NEL3_BAUPA|nr:uncharacterized protein BAUCODRAFT_156309 [Baudoinia panamericana UAMH 10762]EMC97684.1 hypothetical protein BAUCODRAFT_156309 [Baudoinia panamericana UAMH 10762]
MLGLFTVVTLAACVAAASTSQEADIYINWNATDLPLTNSTGYYVLCKNCSVVGDIAFSGDSSFSALPFDFGDTRAWVAAVVKSFHAVIELQFVISDPDASTAFAVQLGNPLSPTLAGFGLTSEFFGIGVDLSVVSSLLGYVNATSPVNFTYGFEYEITIRNGTDAASPAIWLPILNMANATVVGFNASAITPTKYSSPDPNDNFDFQIQFGPSFFLQGDFLGHEVAGAGIWAPVISEDVTVSQAVNVTSSCEPAPSGAKSDHIYHNLTNVVPTRSFGWGVDFSAADNYIDGDIVFNSTPFLPMPTSCLAYDPRVSALVAVPAKSTASGNAVGNEGGTLLPLMGNVVMAFAITIAFLEVS